MMFINVTDIYDVIEDHEGNQVEVMIMQNATIPMWIPKNEITLIKPHLTAKGKPYRNMSVIVKRDVAYKVMGNFKSLIAQRLEPEKRPDFKGFTNKK